MDTVFFDMVKSGIVVSALVIFLFGLGYIFAPELVKKINRVFNAIIFQDEFTFNYRMATGTVFIIISLLILFFLYSKTGF